MLIPAKISPVISGAVLLIKNLLIHLVDWIFLCTFPLGIRLLGKNLGQIYQPVYRHRDEELVQM